MPSSKQLRSSLLPLELREEILYRVPMESVVRFKLTCKEWYALFNDRIFIYKHLALSRKRFMQGGDDKSIQLVNPETQAHTCLPIPDEFHSHIFNRTVHCDGLLLCNYTENRNRKLAVWNPILSRVKWIEPSNSYNLYDVYGFGYGKVSRDNYKILRFVNRVGISSEFEIYEFKSKHWRSVDAMETLESCVFSSYQTSMNGNMYWVAHENKMDGSKTETFIQSFDFSTETFKPICCIPKGTDTFCVSSDHTVALSGFRGGRLSLLHQHINVKIDVWVTNKVTDVVVSWSKYFNVTLPHLRVRDSRLYGCFQTHFIDKTNTIMLWCEELDDNHEYTRANVYEMGEGQIKKRVEAGRWKWLDRFLISCNAYVPSLVPLPE